MVPKIKHLPLNFFNEFFCWSSFFNSFYFVGRVFLTLLFCWSSFFNSFFACSTFFSIIFVNEILKLKRSLETCVLLRAVSKLLWPEFFFINCFEQVRTDAQSSWHLLYKHWLLLSLWRLPWIRHRTGRKHKRCKNRKN